jgi:hypothetical protein
MGKYYGWFIKDSFGGFDGDLFLTRRDLEKGSPTVWNYHASRKADRWYLNKAKAEARIKELEEYQNVAQIPGLSWELIYGCYEELSPSNGHELKSIWIEKEISRGFMGKTRQAVVAIYKKYKAIYKEVSASFNLDAFLKEREL